MFTFQLLASAAAAAVCGKKDACELSRKWPVISHSFAPLNTNLSIFLPLSLSFSQLFFSMFSLTVWLFFTIWTMHRFLHRLASGHCLLLLLLLLNRGINTHRQTERAFFLLSGHTWWWWWWWWLQFNCKSNFFSFYWNDLQEEMEREGGSARQCRQWTMQQSTTRQ